MFSFKSFRNKLEEYYVIWRNSKHKTQLLKDHSQIKIGENSLIYYKSDVYTTGGGKIMIGNNCRIGTSSYGYHAGMPFFSSIWAEGEEARVTIGNNCRINGANIHAKGRIKIGNNCVIASGISIIDTNGHVVNSLNRTNGHDNPNDIIIGNNCWIGLNAIILKGTILGDNCVVGAGCVVQGKYPNNSLLKQADVTISRIDYTR